MGFLQAMETFRYQEGVRIGAYASAQIKWSMLNILDSQAYSVSTLSNALIYFKKIGKEKEEFLQSTGREPTLEELAKKVKSTPNTVGNLIQVFQGVLSLNKDVDEEGDMEFGDFLMDSELPVDIQAIQEVGKSMVEVILDKELKSDRDRYVIDERYGLKNGGRTKTLEEVKQELGVSRMRVGQIEAEVLKKLKSSISEQELRNALEELAS